MASISYNRTATSQPRTIIQTITQTTKTQHIHNKTHHPPQRNKPYDTQ